MTPGSRARLVGLAVALCCAAVALTSGALTSGASASGASASGAVAVGADPLEAVRASVAVRGATVGTEGACPTAAGVTVVVDFQDLGGGVWMRCTDGSADTGFQALERAGIPYRTAVRSPGFLCRIDELPAGDPCINPSPTAAYWSYWVAPRGGSWCYSNIGAASRNPPEGTVEGWSFSLNRSPSPPPRIAPPPAVPGAPASLPGPSCNPNPTPSTPPPTSSPPVTTGAATGGGPGPATAPAPGPAAGAGAPAPTAIAPPPGSAATDAAGGTTVVDPADPTAGTGPPTSSATEPGATGTAAEEETGTRTADGRPDGADGEEIAVNAGGPGPSSGTAGSPLGVLVAVVLIAALSATSYVVRRHRTPAAPAPPS